MRKLFQSVCGVSVKQLSALFAAMLIAGCGGKSNSDDPSPIIHIVSPTAGATVSRGEGTLGAGSFNGSGFALILEVVTHDEVGIAAQEGLNIRDTSLLGNVNPKFPGLTVTFDTDLIKPDGTLIPRNTNLAALFNVAGTDDTPGAGITLWTGWHVLESLPEGTKTVTITASARDLSGRVATDKITYNVSQLAGSGQALTPQIAGQPGDGIDDTDGPQVTLVAPRTPSAVATGPAGVPAPPATGSLFFIEVSALDKTGAGIAVNENGQGKAVADLGTIIDPTQIGAKGPNRNYPGLVLTFDVPLRQPNGNVVPAGANLAPIFNIAGSERTAAGILTTAGWVVGGSLVMPTGQTQLTVKASVTDNAGRTGSAKSTYAVSSVENGQALTPAP